MEREYNRERVTERMRLTFYILNRRQLGPLDILGVTRRELECSSIKLKYGLWHWGPFEDNKLLFKSISFLQGREVGYEC